jgi:hypothetical protein
MRQSVRRQATGEIAPVAFLFSIDVDSGWESPHGQQARKVTGETDAL